MHIHKYCGRMKKQIHNSAVSTQYLYSLQFHKYNLSYNRSAKNPESESFRTGLMRKHIHSRHPTFHVKTMAVEFSFVFVVFCG